MIELLGGGFADFQGWLFETAVAPLLYWLGMSDWLEDAFAATEIALLGIIQLVLAWALIRPLELWRPVETIAPADRRSVRDDVWYTILERSGLIPLALFVALSPIGAEITEYLHGNGIVERPIDQWLPWLADWPLATFLIYLVIFDFAGYWLHRGQHAIGWWWQLHALHHDQRHMTFWTDDRNHALDIVIQHAALALLAQLIGVAPGQFVGLVFVTRLIESLSHANLRLSFGALGERLLVSPRFHRRHHAVLESGEARGVNFAVLFPVWDVIFRTADFRPGYAPTGITPEPGMRPYPTGLWGQQVAGLSRMLARLVQRSRPTPPIPAGHGD